MRNAGLRNLAIGGILLIALIFFGDQIAASISDIGFYIVLIIGIVMAVRGLFGIADQQSAEEIASESVNRPLAHEVLLNVLARGAYADTHVANMEVETIQDIYNKITGENLTTADIRIAARADLYESEPFVDYLEGVQESLSSEDKKTIMQALIDVIKADESVEANELDFFNEVAQAIKMSPAELSELER